MSKNNTNAVVNRFFSLDLANEKIIGSKSAMSKANRGYGDEYEEYVRIKAAHPTFTFEEKTMKSNLNGRAKVSYKGLTDEFMKAYINTKGNASALLEEYANAKKIVKIEKKKNEYASAKNWFIDRFGDADADGKTDKKGNIIKHFDMKKAEDMLISKGITFNRASVSANDTELNAAD